MVSLASLPLFVLEGLALREIKKMLFLKQLECERRVHGAPIPEADFYDSIDFGSHVYFNPRDRVNQTASLSPINELFEVLLFNCEDYMRMQYEHVVQPKTSFVVPERAAAHLFGGKQEYYRDMAESFFVDPNDPAIWKPNGELDLSLSWLDVESRRKKQNVWQVIKQLLRAMSEEPSITNAADHGYDKITLGQIVLFVTLLRIRKRMVQLIHDFNRAQTARPSTTSGSSQSIASSLSYSRCCSKACQ